MSKTHLEDIGRSQTGIVFSLASSHLGAGPPRKKASGGITVERSEGGTAGVHALGVPLDHGECLNQSLACPFRLA